MAYMRIHCTACGGTWEIYQRDNWNAENARVCPHCYAEIDRSTWYNYILPAFGAMADANAVLAKDSIGYNRPAFWLDVIAEHSILGAIGALHYMDGDEADAT